MNVCVRRCRFILMLVVLGCGANRLAAADIQAALESPANKQKVTGIGAVTGWAFSTDPQVKISAVKLRVDEKVVNDPDIAWPGERGDVATAFPAFSQAVTVNSGFARVVNFSDLPSGSHKIGVEITDDHGGSKIIDQDVTIIRVGDFALLRNLDLLSAKPSIDGKEVKLTLVEVTEEPADATATAKTQQVTLRLAWQPDRQALGIASSENTSTATTPTKSTSALLAADTQRDSRPEDSVTVRANLENPSDSTLTVSGKELITGWAFSTTPGASIADIHLNIDGTPVQKIPCCTPRADVAQATENKDFSQAALNSGFATEVNFNELSSDKDHTLQVVVTDSAQATKTFTNTVTAVRLGSLSFIDEVDLTNAIMSIQSSNTLRIEKFKVRGKDKNGVEVSQEVIADFAWKADCQCFRTQSSCGDGNVEPGEECDTQALAGESCTSLGFSSGTLSCNDICSFETKNCTGGQSLYVTNLLSNSVSVVDTTTNTVAKTIPVGRSPRAIAISPDGTTAYVTNTGDDTMSIINTADKAVNMTIPVGKGPQSVAVTPDGTKVYIVSGKDNTVVVLDAATKQVLKNVNVGKEPQAIALTPDGTFAYVTNYADNTVSVIDTSSNTTLPPITDNIGRGPNGIAVSPDGKQAYVVNFDGDSISIIDTATKAVPDKPIVLGLSPVRVAFAPDGALAYISSVLDFSLITFDTVKKEKSTDIQIGTEPDGVTVATKGKRVYVAVFGRNGNANLVDVISTITNSRVATIEVGEGPFAVALTPLKP